MIHHFLQKFHAEFRSYGQKIILNSGFLLVNVFDEFFKSYWCYGNASTQKWTQNWVWVHFHLFQELSEIPQKLKSVEGFPNILGWFPLYLHFTRFLFFGVCFLIFLGPFPHFVGSFPVFKKSFKISVFWAVSSFYWVCFLIFLVSFRFSKKKF